MDSNRRGEPAGTAATAPPHPTVRERAAHGRAARTAAPRSSQSALEVSPDRDGIALLETQAASRVSALVPIRYGRMVASPLAFYRGAAIVMTHDLASTPTAGLSTQLAGDAHLSNFGTFASPERDLVFDLNDFDETLPGPFEWDVKRLATSFEIAARDRNFASTDRSKAVLGAVRAYREAIQQFAGMGDLAVWYAKLDAADIVQELREGHDRRLAKTVQRSEAKARRKDSTRALVELTHEVDGEPKIVSEPPLIVPLSELVAGGDEPDDLESDLRGLFDSYRRSLSDDRRVLIERYAYADLARKVVGIGSVGTRSWLLLMLGRDNSDPLFLQIKEAQASVLEPVLGPSEFAEHGRRVVEGQRLMQAASDIVLGWIHGEDEIDGGVRDFYVRQLWDWKSEVDAETILPRGLSAYARACGWTLARSHARSGDRIAIGAYLGRSARFDHAIAEFAAAYADRNEQDHRALIQAVAAGTITAVDA